MSESPLTDALIDLSSRQLGLIVAVSDLKKDLKSANLEIEAIKQHLKLAKSGKKTTILGKKT